MITGMVKSLKFKIVLSLIHCEIQYFFPLHFNVSMHVIEHFLFQWEQFPSVCKLKKKSTSFPRNQKSSFSQDIKSKSSHSIQRAFKPHPCMLNLETATRSQEMELQAYHIKIKMYRCFTANMMPWQVGSLGITGKLEVWR